MSSYGFIGVGNMGGALAKAACRAADPSEIYVSNRTRSKAEALAEELGCRCASNAEIASSSDFIFLGVKPQMLRSLLSEIFSELKSREKRGDRFILVTMAAGCAISQIRDWAGNCPVIRIMPNTPVSIGKGTVLFSCTEDISPDEKAEFMKLMSCSGELVAVPESLMDAGCAISGCGPAFVDLFVEALADGAVACGVPRETALALAAQMVAGSAKLIMETGKHPAVLKDAVCSPGGSTIEGVRALERSGFRSGVIEAVVASYEKNISLGK